MIGLGPPGRVRPWQIATVLTALRAAFPGTRAHVSRFDPTAPDVEFLVVGTVEDPHDLASWYPRRLRIGVAMLDGCRNERALADLAAEGGAEECDTRQGGEARSAAPPEQARRAPPWSTRAYGRASRRCPRCRSDLSSQEVY